MSIQIEITQLQSVPDRLPGWEDNFVIPKQYSEVVMAEIACGRITQVTRRAIVQDVASLCFNYCKYPTMSQLEVVSSKLVATFPVLADTIGTGHVSVVINPYLESCVMMYST